MAEIVYQRPLYRYYPATYAAWLINWVVRIIEALLAFRLVLELLQASSASQFVAWYYGITAGLVAPFSGAFSSFAFGTLTIDITIIFAMICYAVLGWLLIRIFSFIFAALERV